jgi:dienelactone hydrolase
MIKRLLAATSTVFLLCSTGLQADESKLSSELPARIEVIPFESMTLSDAQFLVGEKGIPISIAGVLQFPRGKAAKVPAVIVLHGSGGMNAGYELWSRQLNQIGVATFLVDSFSARGLSNVNASQASLGRLNELMDGYRALDLLSKHPRIDPSRIALLGFSRGGQSTLYAGLSRFNALWNKSGVEFAAYIPFYPDCSTSYIDDTKRSSKATLVIGGTPDDYNPVSRCKEYAQRLKDSGVDLPILELPNAQHGFDSLAWDTTPMVVPNGQSTRNCHIVEKEPGSLVNTDTDQPFSYQDQCVQLNPHVAYDPEAAGTARKAVTELLSQALGLEP